MASVRDEYVLAKLEVSVLLTAWSGGAEAFRFIPYSRFACSMASGITMHRRRYVTVEAVMNRDQRIDKIVHLRSNVGRRTLLTAIFGVALVLETGCGSTSGGVKTALISPATNIQQSSPPEDGGLYRPLRSPGSNDLTGS